MAFRIDTSALYRQPAPSAPSGIGSVLDTIMQRRHQMELQKQQQEAQAAQAKADREAQQAHWNQIDARERDRYAAEDKRYQQKTRAEMTGALVEDYAKNQGRGAGLLAEGYGFKMAPEMEAATPDPRAPAMADIDEDPSAAPIQAKPTGRQMLSRDGESFAFAPPATEGPAQHNQRLREQLMAMPPSPMREQLLMRLAQSEALGLDPKGTAAELQHERSEAAAEKRARISAAGQARREANSAADRAASLGLVDRAGNVVGQARTPAEAAKARGARPTVVAAEKTGEELKAHIDQFGNISRWNPMDYVSGDIEQQAVRDQLIDRLIGARKEITGALNASDVDRYKKQLDTASTRGPEAVKTAIDSFTRELQTMYDAQNESVANGPLRAPGAAPAGGGDRLEAWKRKRGAR